MKFIKEHLKDCLYIGVIIVFVLLYIFKPVPSGKLQDQKKFRDSIAAVIKTDYDSIFRLNKALKVSDSIKAKLEKDYQLNKPKYVQIQKELYIKDSIVNTLSVIDIQREFTNRYKTSN